MDKKQHWVKINYQRSGPIIGEILTLLTADVLRDGGAVTDMRPPLLTGDLLSSLAIKWKKKRLNN